VFNPSRTNDTADDDDDAAAAAQAQAQGQVFVEFTPTIPHCSMATLIGEWEMRGWVSGFSVSVSLACPFPVLFLFLFLFLALPLPFRFRFRSVSFRCVSSVLLCSCRV
jgi:hypothetical protein